MELKIDFFNPSATKENKEHEQVKTVPATAGIPTLEELEKNAYAVKFFSHVLNDHIVVFKEKKDYARVIGEYPDDVLYFAEEVRNLIRFAAGPDEIKTIHTAKRIFRNSWLVKINQERR